MSFKIPCGVNKVPLTIRIDENNYSIIENLAKKNKKSLNEVVNMMISYAIDNMEN